MITSVGTDSSTATLTVQRPSLESWTKPEKSHGGNDVSIVREVVPDRLDGGPRPRWRVGQTPSWWFLTATSSCRSKGNGFHSNRLIGWLHFARSLARGERCAPQF